MHKHFEKSIAAEHCSNYRPKYKLSQLSNRELSISCDQCENMISGECSRNLMEDVLSKISMN